MSVRLCRPSLMFVALAIAAGSLRMTAAAPDQDASAGFSARIAYVPRPTGLALVGNTLYIAPLLETEPIQRVDLATGLITPFRPTPPRQHGGRIQALPAGELLIGGPELYRVNPTTRSATNVEPLDASGNVVNGSSQFSVADSVGHIYLIRSWSVLKIDAKTQALSRVAGLEQLIPGTNGPLTSGDGGPAASAGIGWPRSLALDAADNLYISQTGVTAADNRIRRIDRATGVITTVLGQTTKTVVSGPSAIAAPVTWAPQRIAADGRDGLLFTDLETRILRLDLLTGLVEHFAGSTAGHYGDGGPARVARFQNISALLVAENGDVYIADRGANRVRRISRATGTIATVAGSGGGGPERWSHASYPAPPGQTCRDDLSAPYLSVNVDDPQGGFIPGATVTLMNEDGKEIAELSGVTNEGGIRTLHAPPGNYIVFVVLRGLPPEIRPVRLDYGCSGQLNVTLSPGGR